MTMSAETQTAATWGEAMKAQVRGSLAIAAAYERRGLRMAAQIYRNLAADQLRGTKVVLPPLADPEDNSPPTAAAVVVLSALVFIGLGVGMAAYWGVIHPYNAARVEAGE